MKKTKSGNGPCLYPENNKAYSAARAKRACSEGLQWLRSAPASWKGISRTSAVWALENIPEVLSHDQMMSSVMVAPSPAAQYASRFLKRSHVEWMVQNHPKLAISKIPGLLSKRQIRLATKVYPYGILENLTIAEAHDRSRVGREILKKPGLAAINLPPEFFTNFEVYHIMMEAPKVAITHLESRLRDYQKDRLCRECPEYAIRFFDKKTLRRNFREFMRACPNILKLELDREWMTESQKRKVSAIRMPR